MRSIFNIMDNNQPNNFITIQNVRQDIIGEIDAIIQYEAHIAQTTDRVAKEVLGNIVKEEKHHVGELFGLLFKLDQESRVEFERGLKEFEELN